MKFREWLANILPLASERVRGMWRHLMGLRNAYAAVFSRESVAVQLVLADLDWFCNGSTSTFRDDPIKMAEAAARRDVFLRILNLSGRSPEELYEIYKGSLRE